MSSWYDTLTSAPVLLAGALGISAALFARSNKNFNQLEEQAKELKDSVKAEGAKGKAAQAAASIMSAPATDIPAPKTDPFTPSNLAQYDGSDPSKPLYVAIKGRVFDVTSKPDMYGKGRGYNIFAGKDASKGLGMSSLEAKDAIADYSSLNETQINTLNQWENFFEKRYPIVGKVVPEK